jgi:hypothetical protein
MTALRPLAPAVSRSLGGGVAMPGVFLSHSSKDKAFVGRLAADLVSRGIPVWFDSWELETGDSLYQRIFDGIDDSTFLVLAISPNSNDSKWVGRELTAGLAQEDRIGRTVILPIKIAECLVPLSIADRIYADFTQGYLAGLEALEHKLKRSGSIFGEIPFNRQLVPLRFARQFYLDQVGLQSRFGQLRSQLASGRRLTPEQIVVVNDEIYLRLRAGFLKLLDNLASLPFYSPELETELLQRYETLKKYESALIKGVIEIAHGIIQFETASFFSLCAHLYCKWLRNEIMEILAEMREWSDDSLPDLQEKPIVDCMSRAEPTATFYGVEKVEAFDIFNRSDSSYIRVWLPSNSGAAQSSVQGGISFAEYADTSLELMLRFVIPQMVGRSTLGYPNAPLVWNFDEWLIGPA